MKVTTAKDAKNRFGRLIDQALVQPIAISKHGRPVVVMLAYDEFQRLDQSRRGRVKGDSGRRLFSQNKRSPSR
jgi:prevent-host-death family protein